MFRLSSVQWATANFSLVPQRENPLLPPRNCFNFFLFVMLNLPRDYFRLDLFIFLVSSAQEIFQSEDLWYALTFGTVFCHYLCFSLQSSVFYFLFSISISCISDWPSMSLKFYTIFLIFLMFLFTCSSSISSRIINFSYYLHFPRILFNDLILIQTILILWIKYFPMYLKYLKMYFN